VNWIINFLKPYGTCRKTGVEDLHSGEALETIRNGKELSHQIERARPDLAYSGFDNQAFNIDVKYGSYDKNDPRYWLIISAEVFLMQALHYKPLVYFSYSEPNKEWHVFSIDEAIKSMDHFGHIEPNDMTFIYQQLPAVTSRNIKYVTLKINNPDGSKKDFIRLARDLKEDDYWVKKING
jgi:hypothetical protein